MLGGDKRSYILQETEVFSCGFIVAFTFTQRVNNFCILTFAYFKNSCMCFLLLLLSLCCVYAQDTIIFMNVYCEAC